MCTGAFIEVGLGKNEHVEKLISVKSGCYSWRTTMMFSSSTVVVLLAVFFFVHCVDDLSSRVHKNRESVDMEGYATRGYGCANMQHTTSDSAVLVRVWGHVAAAALFCMLGNTAIGL